MAHQTDNKEWIVCGSSPSADEYLRLCRHRHPLATSIATNSAGRLFPEGPDYFYLSDQIACQKYNDDAKRYQKQGSKLVTLARTPNALKERRVEWFDIFLDVQGPGSTWQFRLGDYTHWCMSGLYTVQFALNNGAERVHLVGHEGYRSSENDPQLDHFDAAPGPTKGRIVTEKIIKPAMQAMIDYCIDVEFYFYGVMNYTVGGQNVQHIGNHECAAKDAIEINWPHGRPGKPNES